jgi:hypothetical protein
MKLAKIDENHYLKGVYSKEGPDSQGVIIRSEVI